MNDRVTRQRAATHPRGIGARGLQRRERVGQVAWRRGRGEFPPEDADRLAAIEKGAS